MGAAADGVGTLVPGRKRRMLLRIIVGIALLAPSSESFVATPSSHRLVRPLGAGSKGADSVDLDYLRTELLEYLDKRRELGADEIGQSEVGKVIGGTKGNVVLEFVSGAPNKERVLEKAPNALDYDELTKYGYGHLVTPIMKAGGRFAMYKLLDLDAPETASALKRVSSPKLVIDRTGETDPNKYTGLKLGQVLDDSVQGEALKEALQKEAGGAVSPASEEALPRSANDEYEIPFSDKRNVGPRQTPDWTPERLDEWGKSQGRVEAWARRAKAGEFVSDPNETLDLTLQQRAFSILTALLVATAFGRSTDAFLVDMVGLAPSAEAAVSIKEALQGPALGLLVASLGSLAYSYLQSKEKNRDPFIWSVKGVLGGPFTIALLRSLDPLITRAEEEEQEKASKEKS